MREYKWRAATLAVFAWFFVVRGLSEETTFAQIGPFVTESQCNEVRRQVLESHNYSHLMGEDDPDWRREFNFGGLFLSRCWEGPTN